MLLFVSINMQASSALAYGPGVNPNSVAPDAALISANQVTWEYDLGEEMKEQHVIDRNSVALSRTLIGEGGTEFDSYLCKKSAKVFWGSELLFGVRPGSRCSKVQRHRPESGTNRGSASGAFQPRRK